MRIVEVRPALRNPIGVLVIGGKGAQLVDFGYATGVARAAVGLVFGALAAMESDSEKAAGEDGAARVA
jgi:hypothetical protein